MGLGGSYPECNPCSAGLCLLIHPQRGTGPETVPVGLLTQETHSADVCEIVAASHISCETVLPPDSFLLFSLGCFRATLGDSASSGQHQACRDWHVRGWGSLCGAGVGTVRKSQELARARSGPSSAVLSPQRSRLPGSREADVVGSVGPSGALRVVVFLVRNVGVSGMGPHF